MERWKKIEQLATIVLEKVSKKVEVEVDVERLCVNKQQWFRFGFVGTVGESGSIFVAV